MLSPFVCCITSRREIIFIHIIPSLIMRADIDECQRKDIYPCFGVCANTVGSYNCTCPTGTSGDAYTINGCRRNDKFTLAIKIAIGKPFLLLIIVFTWFKITKSISNKSFKIMVLKMYIKGTLKHI
jgi:hypothetical protein